MGEAIQLAVSMAPGLQNLGTSAAWVIGGFLLWFFLWRGKGEQHRERERDEATAEKRLRTRAIEEEGRANREAERANREAARSNRLMDALRVWCGWTHDCRHARIADRHAHVNYELRLIGVIVKMKALLEGADIEFKIDPVVASLEPLEMVDPPLLPRLIEEDEE